jgi:hypothetical protein
MGNSNSDQKEKYKIDNLSKLDDVIELIEEVKKKTDLSSELKNKLKNKLKEWYIHTFEFGKFIYNEMGNEKGEEYMMEIQEEVQEGKVYDMQDYFFKSEWGMEYMTSLRNEYGDEHDLED